jgi:glycosyltransferase involved in cell wall biosynthesis
MVAPRIAHVINSIGLGGVPEAAYQLLRVLPRARYDTRLCVLKPLTDDQESRVPRLARFRELDVPVAFQEPHEHKLGTVSALAGWIRREQIEVLHTHSYKPNLYARLAGTLCKDTGLKIVAHYHNSYEANWKRDDTLELDRLLAARSDRIVACSRSVKQHLVEWLGIEAERIRVIGNGVELERFAPSVARHEARRALGFPADAKIVALVGRISEQKGQEELIRAAQSVRLTVPEALFLIVGAPDQPERAAGLAALVGELGLRDAVRFCGFVTDMPLLYAAIDVLAAPSRWEGFGLMLVEAMAAGLPIVASRVGAIPDVVAEDETALLVPPADPPSLAAAIASLLGDPRRARRMGELGRKRAQLFSWERAGRELDALYADLLWRAAA